MNKISMVIAAAACLINTVAFGAAKECSYSPLQQVIRTARSESDIMNLINNNVNLNIHPKCGGNVYQLAILRGNAGIVKTLIESSGLQLDVKVPNTDYPILGAPKEIPLIFFAAYHAPSIEIMRLLINSGVNILETDSRGETILWYLNQNPVLMNTDLVDEITQKLIMGSSAASISVSDSAHDKTDQADKVETNENNKDAPKAKAKKASKERKSKENEGVGLVEAEPDAPYKPTELLNQTDF